MRVLSIFVAIVAFLSVSAFAITTSEIVEKAYKVSKADEESYTDFTCSVTEVTKDEDGNEMAKAIGKLYFKQPDKEYFELSEYYEDGKLVDVPEGEEDDEEELELKFPFDEEYYDDYKFKYKESDTVSKRECYVISISSNKKGEGYIYGDAWIEKKTYKMVKVFAKFYKQPKHVSESSMTMYFKEFAGHTVMSKIKIYAKASFLLFIKKKIYITNSFSNYKFDTGLSNNLFK